MILSNASCLIKTRLYNIGFPKLFQYYPDTMDGDDLENFNMIALETMEEPKGILAEDGLRRCIISNKKHLVMGVSGFLCDISKDIAEEYSYFCDLSETRRCYGFFAFVWNLETSRELPAIFPSTNEFAKLIDQFIIPYWKYSDNSIKAEDFRRGITCNYDISVEMEDIDGSLQTQEFNLDPNRTMIVYSPCLDDILREAIAYAKQGNDISICTGGDANEAADTIYKNWVVLDVQDKRELIEKSNVPSSSKNNFDKTPYHGTSNDSDLSNDLSGSTESKWVVMIFAIHRNYNVDELGKFIANLGNQGALEVDGPYRGSYIDFKHYEMEIYLKLPVNIENDDIVESISQEIKCKHKKGFWAWLSSSIDCIDVEDNGDCESSISQCFINEMRSTIGSVFRKKGKNLKGDNSEEKEDESNNDGQKLIDRLQELYGRTSADEEKNNVFKNNDLNKNDPFKL